MSAPANAVYTSGTGAAPVTADGFNTFCQFQINYSGLKGFTGLANMTVYMQGYTSPNDGGQGMFYWSTTTGTDDGGVTTIVPNGSTSGCWLRSAPNLIIGVTTNSNAPTGFVGEYQTNSTYGVSLSTAATSNATSLSLTAGDWDVWGSVQFVPAGSTAYNSVLLGINTTSSTIGALGTYIELNGSFVTGNPITLSTPVVRISLASATTVYLPALANFSVSTMIANGFIAARRVR